MTLPKTRPNPDLLVGDGNKPRWNQPATRRHGFHHAHLMFRRVLSCRAPEQVVLEEVEDTRLAATPEVALLTGRPEFSALVVAQEGRVLLARHASDFAPDQPHSIQSISKLTMHLIASRLMADGRLKPAKLVEHYLPEIGSGFRGARVQDVLDMNVINHFSEDYDDAHADVYAEEAALGFRLPGPGEKEPTMLSFLCGITGGDLTNQNDLIRYSSANTDLLTVICDRLCPGNLPGMLDEIAGAAGLEGGFHMSMSREGLPAFSGGGCLTATDLARFGLLLVRVAKGQESRVGDTGVTRAALNRTKRHLPAPRDHIRYADQLMTDGRWIGHSGYGGQFLMADTVSGRVVAYLSVLENESGFCADYMAQTVAAMERLLPPFG